MKNKSKLDFDRSRPFTICSNYQEFQNLGLTSRQIQKRNRINEDVVEVSKDQFNKSNENKDEDIVVPAFEQKARLTKYKPVKIQSNYIRYSGVYPCKDQYQLRQADVFFLFQLRKQFPTVQQQFLKEQIIELERRIGRSDISKKNIEEQCNKYLKRLTQRRQTYNNQNLVRVGKKIFEYWCIQRKILNYPLYRPLWRPNLYQYDHYSAFRPREKEKRNLRRLNRIPEAPVIENLLKEYETAHRICQKVRQREQIKLDLVNSQILEWRLAHQQDMKQYLLPQINLQQNIRISQELISQEQSSQEESDSFEQMESQQIIENTLKTSKFINGTIRPYDYNVKDKTIFPSKERANQSYNERFNKFKDLNSDIYESVNRTANLHNKSTHSEYFSSYECGKDISDLIRRFNNKSNQKNSN